MFDPKSIRFPYPEHTDEHYLKPKKDNGLILDKDYPYIDKARLFLFKQSLVRIVLRLIVFPMTYIRLGLRIEGKENLRKYRSVIDKGVISVCNHVHMWDYLCIMNAIKPRKPRILVWAPNVRGENAGLVRMVGGIPIPEGDYQATLAYLHHIESHLNEGGWLHIYSEGSMWEYYAPIRPFKRGAAYLSKRYDKPIIPLAFSYRKPSKLRKALFKQEGVFTLSIGEPIFPEDYPEDVEGEIAMTKDSHDAVCRLAGINPKENIYPPLFANSKRVDYYTDHYGKGYKRSC